MAVAHCHPWAACIQDGPSPMGHMQDGLSPMGRMQDGPSPMGRMQDGPSPMGHMQDGTVPPYVHVFFIFAVDESSSGL